MAVQGVGKPETPYHSGDRSKRDRSNGGAQRITNTV